MSRQVQIRRGTAAEHENFTGAIGEITMDTDNKNLRLHDGETPGGLILAPLTRTVALSSTEPIGVSMSVIPNYDGNIICGTAESDEYIKCTHNVFVVLCPKPQSKTNLNIYVKTPSEKIVSVGHHASDYPDNTISFAFPCPNGHSFTCSGNGFDYKIIPMTTA